MGTGRTQADGEYTGTGKAHGDRESTQGQREYMGTGREILGRGEYIGITTCSTFGQRK